MIIKADFKKLENLIKLLRTHKYVDVGILGNETNNKDGKGVSVAYYGAVNYFGADIQVTEKMRSYLHSIGLHLKADTKVIHIPARNFIEMPIEKKEKEIERTLEKVFPLIIKEESINKFLKQMGLACEGAIQEAFDTSGWSEWSENHPFTIQQKGSATPLIGEGDAVLRKSITSRVGG